VTGTVTKLTRFGAFVELEPGIEGLIPMGEMSWGRVHSASEVVQKGERVTAKLLNVDAKRRRMSLSLKQMGEDPWLNVDAKYAEDSVIEGTVTRTADFGAFVELEPGIEGMIHISQLSTKRVTNVEAAVKAGQTVQAKVLSVDTKQRRIGLSIRALQEPEERPDSRRPEKVSRADLRKYVVKQEDAHAGESLGALFDKFGGEDGDLKGGIG
jgi:small subunit ribosomal protein S1